MRPRPNSISSHQHHSNRVVCHRVAWRNVLHRFPRHKLRKLSDELVNRNKLVHHDQQPDARDDLLLRRDGHQQRQHHFTLKQRGELRHTAACDSAGIGSCNSYHAMKNQTHQEQVQSGADIAHEDARAALNEARHSNPFTWTNVLLAIGLAIGTWKANQIWGTIQEGQKSQAASVVQIQSTMSGMHDALLQHGYKLDTLQSDVSVLKANCMTMQAVDERIRLIGPTVPHASLAPKIPVQASIP
jgi:hypothetical protein